MTFEEARELVCRTLLKKLFDQPICISYFHYAPNDFWFHFNSSTGRKCKITLNSTEGCGQILTVTKSWVEYEIKLTQEYKFSLTVLTSSIDQDSWLKKFQDFVFEE